MGRKRGPQQPKKEVTYIGEEKAYVVQEILDKKVEDGTTLYLLKWKDYEGENTWEPIDNLVCLELFDQFEQKWKLEHDKKKAVKKPKKPSVSYVPIGLEEDSESGQLTNSTPLVSVGPSSSSESSSKTGIDLTTGLRTGVKPEKILKIEKTESGEIMFLIKWKDLLEADLIPASVANVKWPQVVIRFYEERMEWQNVYRTDED